MNQNGKMELLLSGEIDEDLTTCNTGEKFDLILKNDAQHLANWIFNVQPLQHDVEEFLKPLVR